MSTGRRSGRKVSETEIARAFSISRQPVREAFIKLADDGLVEIRPQRGTLVRKVHLGSVMDARFVREAVEAEIVKIVARLGDPAIVANLRRQIEAQRSVIDQLPEQFMDLDARFHRSLASAAGKATVLRIVDNVKAQMDRVRFITLMDRSVIEVSIEQHAMVVDAIERGDPEAAEAAMRDHLRQVLKDLPLAAAIKPEFFEDAAPVQNGIK